MTDTDPELRETYDDDSGRGEHYLDDRTVVAMVYDGLTLKATLHDMSEVEMYRKQRDRQVLLTPAGEHRDE